MQPDNSEEETSAAMMLFCFSVISVLLAQRFSEAKGRARRWRGICLLCKRKGKEDWFN